MSRLNLHRSYSKDNFLSHAQWIAIGVSLLIHGGFAVGAIVAPERKADPTRATMELVDRKLPEKEKPKIEKKEEKKIEPPLDNPKEDPKEKKVIKKKIKVVKEIKKPVETPPEGQEDAKEKAAPDTGAKTFGIEMNGTTTAAPGTGVAVQKGQTLKQDPKVKRIGKGKPKPEGFKKEYQRGERAPIAVITARPKVLRQVMPVYPERMKDLEIEGQVILKLTIGADGKVQKIKILKSLRKEFDEAAIAAAKKMKFSPAMVGKTPVTTTIPYKFTFVLD